MNDKNKIGVRDLIAVGLGSTLASGLPIETLLGIRPRDKKPQQDPEQAQKAIQAAEAKRQRKAEKRLRAKK